MLKIITIFFAREHMLYPNMFDSLYVFFRFFVFFFYQGNGLLASRNTLNLLTKLHK